MGRGRIEMVADATKKSMPADMSFGERVEVCVKIMKRVMRSYDAAGKEGAEVRAEIDKASHRMTDAIHKEVYYIARAHGVAYALEKLSYERDK